MKIIKIVLTSLCALSLSITVMMPFLSSHMQGHYKAMLDPQNAKEVLEKKQLWVQLGETPIFFYIFLVFFAVLMIFYLIALAKKRIISKRGHDCTNCINKDECK